MTMIMLRSTRLCVCSKVLVPFEAYCFQEFLAQRHVRSRFFSHGDVLGCQSRTKRRFFHTQHAKSFLLLSPHKTISFAFARAREYTRIIAQRRTRRKTSAIISSRGPLLIVLHRTRAARVCRALEERNKRKHNNELSLLV
jgi:hypothetical protein